MDLHRFIFARAILNSFKEHPIDDRGLMYVLDREKSSESFLQNFFHRSWSYGAKARK